MKKSLTEWIQRIEVVTYFFFQIPIEKKDSIIHENILILYYTAADDIGKWVLTLFMSY